MNSNNVTVNLAVAFAGLVCTVSTMGIVVPFLVSQPDTISVILGMFVLFAAAAFTGYFLDKAFSSLYQCYSDLSVKSDANGKADNGKETN